MVLEDEDLSWAVVKGRGQRDRGSGLDATFPSKPQEITQRVAGRKACLSRPWFSSEYPVSAHACLQSAPVQLCLPDGRTARVCGVCDVGSYRATTPELHKPPRGKKMPQCPLII